MSLSKSAMFFYPWYPAMMLALEAGNVIDMRLWKIARRGDEGTPESRLMVKEEIRGAVRSRHRLGRRSSAQIIEMYRKHVAANAARLG
jgi:hypothetical protein